MYVFIPKYGKRAGKNMGKLSQYALQIIDFTLNMPHEFLGPVATPPPPPIKYQEYLPGTETWRRETIPFSFR